MISTLLNERFIQATALAFPEIDEKTILSVMEIVASSNEKFGHYQFNSAMRLSKVLKKNPKEIAEQIVEKLNLENLIEKVEIAGPGFINISLKILFLNQAVQNILSNSHLGVALAPIKQKIIIDFSSPNIAKEMHVGHLRSTIIGDSLARLFEFLGHDVLRLNHVGDWGTSFGMLIAFLKKEHPDVITGQEKVELAQLVQWYKASKICFDADPSFKKAAQAQVVALQSGEALAIQAWKIICEISRQAYQEIYDLLSIKILERGESFYNPMLAEVVAELESKNLVTLSDGAKCIYLEGFQNREGEALPLMVQKSDGGYNYDTTDMAAIRQRIQEERGDRLIYVTDAGQAQHFQMIFQAAERAGYLKPAKVRVDHVPFGLVLGADGKKFRTRSGDTEKLIDLLLAAIDRAEKILLERSPEMDEAERKALARALGIGAVKYADLSCHRTGDYTFSYDRMLRFDGNTAAFLMYAYVRVAGIKRRINAPIEKILFEATLSLEHPSEIALGLHLTRFSDTLQQVTEDLLPHRLTDYLYILAEKFNAFFRDCRVEGTKQQNSRLLLSEAVARVLKQGLDILGVPTVEKM